MAPKGMRNVDSGSWLIFFRRDGRSLSNSTGGRTLRLRALISTVRPGNSCKEELAWLIWRILDQVLVCPLVIEKVGYQTRYLSFTGEKILYVSIFASSKYGKPMRLRSLLFFSSTTHAAQSQGVLTQSFKKILGNKFAYYAPYSLTGPTLPQPWSVLILLIGRSSLSLAYAQYRYPQRTQGTSSKK